MSQPSVLWSELTASELGALAKAGAIVVLPVASMEQHGPHLGVGVDTVLCGSVCKLAAEATVATRPVVVAPTVWVGMAEHHMAHGGTFTLDIPTYRALLMCLLKSIERDGFTKVLIVNGHGGNVTALNSFLPDFARETSLAVAVTTYFELAQSVMAPLLEDQNSVLHACEVETSLMMVLAPGSVRPERLSDATGPNFPDSRLVLMPLVQRFRSIKSFAPSGVVGDARKASKTKGEALLAATVDALAQVLIKGEAWG
ncbi:MAG: creatininase family protein [Alphaproteobacteria bacterium]